MIQMAALLPIAPLILLPFAIVFFIAVFPVWLVAMILLGLVRAIVRLLPGGRQGAPARSLDRAFHWVKSFGGLIHLDGKTPTSS